MRLARRRFLHLAAGAASLPALPRIARAQGYPSRPITIVVPFAAGGSTDVAARILSERMRSSLGQPVIIENVAGGNGGIGVGRVARATPDGYTIVIGIWNTHVANGALYTLPYDVLNDFEPISLIATQPYLIEAKKTMPANDLHGLIAWLKANPNKASLGHAGIGGGSHVAGVLFQTQTGARFQSVPYRGGSAALQDLLGGQIDIMIDPPANSQQQVRLGNIKAYAVTAKTRLASAPDIPTVDEAGLPGFYMSLWQAFFAPKGTPKDVIVKLNAATVEALADSTVRSRLADLGQEIYSRDQQTPEALRAFQKAEIDKWWPIIKAANIKGE